MVDSLILTKALQPQGSCVAACRWCSAADASQRGSAGLACTCSNSTISGTVCLQTFDKPVAVQNTARPRTGHISVCRAAGKHGNDVGQCLPLLPLPAAAAVTPQLMVASSSPSTVELSVVLLL